MLMQPLEAWADAHAEARDQPCVDIKVSSLRPHAGTISSCPKMYCTPAPCSCCVCRVCLRVCVCVSTYAVLCVNVCDAP